MFNFLNKLNIPKATLTCLTILVIVLIVLYFATDFINKDKLPFEHYENQAQGLDDFTDTLNLKI